MSSIAPLTHKGAVRLREELEHAENRQAPAGHRCHRRSARAWRLKENAEYHAAREQQSFIEGRIRELEFVLSHCQIIDVSKLNAGTRVVFGATVELIDVDTDLSVTYKIVGDLESDIKQRMISISSPIARAMIGKHEGDAITIEAPGGQREYEICAVRYID